MTIRVEAKGIVFADKEANVDAKFNSTPETFSNDLGKAIYGVEKMGFDFNTATVYDKAIAKFEDVKHLLKPNRYTVIYSDSMLAVKVLA